MRVVEKSAKTVEEAIQLALAELKVSKEKADVEIIEQPNKGFLGILGSKLAKVKVTVKEDERDIAHKFMRDVLDAMNIRAEIRIKNDKDVLYVELAGPKMGTIIGRRGQTLDSLQYLLNLAVNKNRDKDSHIKVILDTENYRTKREETLVRLANRLAHKVAKTGKRVELEPMNPYERRIIHAALQDYPGITTYSEGEEPYRKVIIANK